MIEETPETVAAYRDWLASNDVSRPHRSGRWRVRLSDTTTVNLLPYALEVGGYSSDNPTRDDYEFFCKWRDSDERRQKQNAAGYLRFAFGRRHKCDGNGVSQRGRVRDIAADIHTAMRCFAQGDDQGGKSSMASAWGSYILMQFIEQKPMATLGYRVTEAHKNRDDAKDKQDFIGIVRELSKTLSPVPRTVKEWTERPELAAYKRKYPGRDTLRGWIKEALPGSLKPGAPKKHTVT
ncbi:MAG: hypothetical protein KGZ83_14115 [Sulfuricella sp.]|nr:hypothetical protein [Sulfuricella sp.]